MSLYLRRCLKGAAVEDLEGGDFVLVFADELLEGLNDGLGVFGGLGVEAGLEDFVFADRVDGLLVGLF